MISIKIDGVELPLRSESIELPGYNADKLHSVEQWRQGSEVCVEVVSTPESDRVMCYAFDIHAVEKFNSSLHRATIVLDGVEIFEGMAVLLATEFRDHIRHYKLRIRSGGSDWADQVAHTQLNATKLGFSMNMNLNDIEQSWMGDKPVRFLPIRRDSYPESNISGLWSVQRKLMPNDYHPFLSVSHIIRSIAQRAGYKLRSKWLESQGAQKLMMSGAYKQVDRSWAEQKMGFKAYRTRSTSAVADNAGFVYASEPQMTSNLGAIVDSTSQDITDEEGNKLVGAYNNGGALQFVDGVPTFTPTHEVSLSLEYRIRYNTEYRITSSRYLTGFDHIYLGSGCDVEFKLENPYLNVASSLMPNIAYRLYIFDYDDEHDYILSGIGAVTQRISNFVTTENSPTSVQLLSKLKSESSFTPHEGDWAVYNGFVEERGSRDVELIVNTPFVTLTAAPHQLLNAVSFYGAEPHQQITLLGGCCVRTIFSGAVGFGDMLSYADVANHNISQQRVLEAVAHMFNLCIYSHEPSRTLLIEPYDDFYSGDVVDWRHRQLPDQWSIVEGAPESFQHVRLLYAGGDGVVVRSLQPSDKELGEWTISFPGYGTKQGVDSRRNPLFFPTVSLTESIGSAPTAEILTVGDRDLPESDYIEPRVVLYHGMSDLPEGSLWSANSLHEGYPHAAFHSTSKQESLCFEDRDGCRGLNQYYQRELSECALRGSLRCKIHIPIVEYLSLFDINLSTPTIRSRFRLEVEGASSLYTLRQIEDYDSTLGVATCIFRRALSD